MADDTKSFGEPSVSALVGGIVTDAQKLIEQQFGLLRLEVDLEIRRAKSAAVALGLGAGITAFGGALLVLMVVQGLHTHTGIPLWGSYGIVGGLLAGVGGLLLYRGQNAAADVQLIPPPATAESLRENLEWLKHPTTDNNPKRLPT
jgi:hypothetical protein